MTRGRKGDAPEVRAAKAGRPAPKARPVKVDGNTVSPPKWLKKSPAAQRVWNEIAPLLQRINALTPLDAFPFARYCRYSADWIAADEAVRTEGVWYDTADTNGLPTKKRHPAFHARQELDKALREIEGAFGMRPDMRFKLLRDQALVSGSLGPLFAGEGAQAPHSEEPAPAPDEDIIGALGQYNSAPPGSRPN